MGVARAAVGVSLVVSLAAGPAGAVSAPEEAKSYSFALGGEPFAPLVLSLEGRPGSPREGDVVAVRGFLLVLGAPGQYAFRLSEEGDSLSASAGGGARPVVAIASGGFLEIDPARGPLFTMGVEGMRALRGVELCWWPRPVDRRLALLDLPSVCLAVGEGAASEAVKAGFRRPEGLRYLSVRSDSSSVIGALLIGGDDLRLFQVSCSGDRFDAAALAPCRGLRWLSLSARSIANRDLIGSIRNLRALDVAECDGVEDVSFVRRLGELRWLGLSRTRVTDLSPLGGLESLEHVDASATPLSRLPTQPMPALKTLNVLSTAVADDAVAGFRRTNPRCRVLRRWTEALRGECSEVTRLRVRTGGSYLGRSGPERTLFEIDGATDVARLLQRIEIDDAASGGSCLCGGWPTLEFHRGAELVAAVSIHHGRSLRWSAGAWPGDAALTPGSAAFLRGLLAEHGVVEPKGAREAAEQPPAEP